LVYILHNFSALINGHLTGCGGRQIRGQVSSMKRLAILGSTGSIGQSTLAVVAEHPNEFAVTGLAAGQNVKVLAEQIRQFCPAWVSVQDETVAASLRN